jgi:hypothetical protein
MRASFGLTGGQTRIAAYVLLYGDVNGGAGEAKWSIHAPSCEPSSGNSDTIGPERRVAELKSIRVDLDMRALFHRFRADPHTLRRVAVYAVLAAFMAQGLLTQSHRHFAEPGFLVSGISAALDPESDKRPLKSDRNNCPICHVASIAGALVAPTTSILKAPSLGTLIGPRDERVVVAEHFTVHWRSRAPPLV